MYHPAGSAATRVYHFDGDCFRVPDVRPDDTVHSDRAAAPPVQGNETRDPAGEQHTTEGRCNS